MPVGLKRVCSCRNGRSGAVPGVCKCLCKEILLLLSLRLLTTAMCGALQLCQHMEAESLN